MLKNKKDLQIEIEKALNKKLISKLCGCCRMRLIEVVCERCINTNKWKCQ